MDQFFDRQINRYVDRKLDAFLQGPDARRGVPLLKVMTLQGQPLDSATEERLQEQLGDLFEPYRAVHDGAARPERIDRTSRKGARILP